MTFSFDEQGFLPPQVIRCSTTEFYENFVEPFPLSETRKLLYENWLEYVGSLRELTGEGFTQWLNGSFVTAKLNPQDLDMVTFIDYQIYRKFEIDLEPFWTHTLKIRVWMRIWWQFTQTIIQSMPKAYHLSVTGKDDFTIIGTLN